MTNILSNEDLVHAVYKRDFAAVTKHSNELQAKLSGVESLIVEYVQAYAAAFHNIHNEVTDEQIDQFKKMQAKLNAIADSIITQG